MLSCGRGVYVLKKWGSRTLDGLTPCGVQGCSSYGSQLPRAGQAQTESQAT